MIYISIVGYALIAGLLLWGMKFAGKGKFHEDFTSLEVTKGLQGVTAICVMMHHISQTTAFRETNTLSIFPEIGPLFVGIFFFCSGFGLIKSLKKKPGYLDTFCRKRLPAIIIPFYTMTLMFAFFFVMGGIKMPVARWVLSLVGLITINTQAWYAIVIMIMYLAFYVIFKNVKSEKVAYSLIGVIILVQMVFCICWGHLAWWAGDDYWWTSLSGHANAEWWMAPCTLWFQGEWWCNSTLAMLFGMLFAGNEEKVIAWMKRNYWVKLVALAVLFVAVLSASFYTLQNISYWTEFNPMKKTLGITDKFICLIPQVGSVILFVLLLFAIMMKFRTINPAISFLGKRTYEIYLMHNMFLLGAASLISKGAMPGQDGEPILDTPRMALFAVIVIVGGVLVGMLFHEINSKIIKKVTR